MGQTSTGNKKLVQQQPIKLNWSSITRENPCRILTDHIVWTIDLSPDGKYIASAGGNNYSIKIWDPETSKQVGQSLQGHTNNVSAIKYSQCGNYIVSCSHDQTIRQWSAKNYREVCDPIIVQQDGQINCVLYSLNQYYILSCSDDQTIRFWRTKTCQEISAKRIRHTMTISCMALTQRNNMLAFGDNLRQICIWNYKKHIQYRRLLGHSAEINSISFSIDSKLMVSGSNDQTIRLWEVLKGCQIINIRVQHYGTMICSANMSADMKFIVSGSSDKTVRIWNRFTGNQVGQSLNLHSFLVVATYFSLDGRHIITGGFDSQIKVMIAPIDQHK